MKSIHPYIAFDGNAEDAFNFYRSVFGGEFEHILRWKDLPADEQGCGEMGELAETDKEKIMHIDLPIGKSNVLMGNDIPGMMRANFNAGNNFSVVVDTESKEEADEVYKKLSAGGTSMMPMADSFWGDYFGMLVDKFGIQWMIGFNEKG